MGAMARMLNLFVLAGALAAINGAHAAPPTAGSCASITPRTCVIAAALGRGVNLGEMLDAPREGDYGLRLEPAFMELAAANFQTVRIPVRWSNHAAVTADATLDEFFAERVDSVVDAMLAKGVFVILNVHNYRQLTGKPVQNNEAPVDPAVVEQRLLNIWAQLAKRYRNRSDRLLFEIFNEPVGPLEGKKWNVLGAEALRIIRQSNPQRVVLFGPTQWNHPKALAALVLPADPNLIVPVHVYDPAEFTHQGASWTPQFADKVGVACCDTAQRKKMTDALDLAQRWSQEHGYPVVVGEFGSYEKADMASRVTYTRLFRDEVEKRGFSWTYWSFAGGFGIYSAKNRAWIEPLRSALLD